MSPYPILNSSWAKRDVLLSALLALLLIGGLVGGIFVYHSLRTFVARSQLPIFPEAVSNAEELPLLAAPEGMPDGSLSLPETEGLSPAPGSAPPEAGTLPPVPTERLTVLIMGIDRRDGEEGPWRTDSMILVSIDPATRSVAMLSTPRDLFVTIPDYGQGEYLDRINKAFFLGDAMDYPGGGAALAKQTIRRNFGIEVDRHIVMDFDGFRRIVDYIGGIEVEVPERLVDNEYPTEDYGYMTVRFEAGRQHMDGERALIYSRTRKSTSDFARAERQQQVILAVRDRVLSLDIIPSMTPGNLARLIATLDESIQTDLTLEETLAFAQIAQEVKSSQIQRVVIDPTMIRDFVTDQGAQVLLPRWDKVLPLVEETFDITLLPIAPTPVIPPTRTPTPEPVATVAPRREARIEIWNGTETEGIESMTATLLRAEGFNIIATGTAGTLYPRTTILIYNAAMGPTAERLRQRYNLTSNDIYLVEQGNPQSDIVLIVGNDALASQAGGGTP